MHLHTKNMVPMGRIELPTSPLPRECSTTEPHGRISKMLRNAGAGEGNRTLVISLEGFSSTIELHPQRFIKSFANNLHSNLLTRFYVKFLLQLLLSLILILTAGGESWIRTNVGVSQQIYSLPPLAARASLREP